MDVHAFIRYIVPDRTWIQKSNNYSALQKLVIDNPPEAELYLLNLALKNPENLETIKNSEVLEQFSHGKLAELIFRIHQKYIQNLSEFDSLTASLVDMVEPPQILNLQFEKELTDLKPEEELKLIDDCIKRVKESARKRKAKELTQALKSRPEEQNKILEELRDLQKSKIGTLKDLN